MSGFLYYSRKYSPTQDSREASMFRFTRLFAACLFICSGMVIFLLPAYGAWNLVWEDDFSKDAPGAPDPSKWGYDSGQNNGDEKQYFVVGSTKNARVENGMLIIEARKEQYNGKNYTSAQINTQGKASWTYGRLEALAKVPAGHGPWPAFWTLGTNIDSVGWPSCGEIDIDESPGQWPTGVLGSIHAITQDANRSYDYSSPICNAFHIYAIEWYSDRIDFYFDTTKYFTVSITDNSFKKPQYILFDLAIGGGLGGTVDDSIFNSPVQYQVKYVRVYQQSGTSDTTPPQAVSTVNDGTGSDIGSTALSTSLSANWTASTDPDSGISGYKYAIGTSAGASNILNWTALGNLLSVTRTGLSLAAGTTYYFSVKAVNGAALEGSAANSNGQFVRADTVPPGAPGTVNDGTGTDISSTLSTTQLAANWTAATDNAGVTKYWYAIGTSAGASNTAAWTDNGTALSVTKTGLSLAVGTTYYFTVRAQDAAGNQGPARNSNGQVVLLSQDTTPPAISNVIVTNITNSGATITWTTNEPATSQVSYGLTTVYGSNSSENGNLVTSHSVQVSGLQAGTPYHFKAVSRDASSNAGQSGDNTFTTTAPAGDTTPPAISTVKISDLQGTNVVITWTTDEPATGRVIYGKSTDYGSSTNEDANLSVSHSVKLSNLTAGTKYHYKVESGDAAGNAADSNDLAFTTDVSDQLNAKVYPNPFIMQQGANMTFSTSGTNGGTVDIYTISGKLVKSIPIAAGTTDANWDLSNGSGTGIKSGIYIYVIKDNAGNKKTGKIAITN
jgi:beta-glucanase (GH16 family)